MLTVKNEIGPPDYSAHRTMLQPYSIPKSMWESLEAVLFTKGIALAKEVAAELNVSPKEIIAHLKLEESSKFILLPDDENAVYQCQAITQHAKVYLRCRCPAFGSAPRFCANHMTASTDVPCLPLVRRLQREEVTYIYNPITNEVSSLNGVQCGTFNGNKLVLFDIQE